MIRETVERSGIDSELIEDVVMGSLTPTPRPKWPLAALEAGRSIRLPGLQASVRDHA
ncbi:hypothetical protein ACH47B_38055 [Rhodococcus sp. NPDC019627]|uniref:hypothetical protein n=1 Tax=unclassified Rhodococcus (in: high G+C Gram-positive bacteria) TaxID=192944 RepID=UPI0033D18E34